jgi:hypothetical protein
VRALLGPSWIVEGEDPALYEELLARVGAALRPADIVDWLLLKDVVALTWEIQRSRRQRDSLVRMARGEAMKGVLATAVARWAALDKSGAHAETQRVADNWLHGERGAAKRAQALLSKVGLCAEDVAAQSLYLRADHLDRLDRQAERHECRRDAILQQIARRRAGWARHVRRATEDVVDAQFEEHPPPAADRPANGAAPGQS